jgi:hypothetical protein
MAEGKPHATLIVVFNSQTDPVAANAVTNRKIVKMGGTLHENLNGFMG